MTGSAESRHPRYDVFLSLGGSDREPGARLAAELRAAGLRVFVDEDDIEYFAGVTRQIQEALGASRVFVVYYSRGYPSRPSCQLELTAALLAGQAGGDAVSRVVVVNPEETTAHLQPAELADARFIGTSAGLDQVAAAIRERVRRVPGVIGDAGFRRAGPQHGRVTGAAGFVGHYRGHWDLHTVLHANDFAMTQESTHAPVVAVGGLPGIGKTAFVAAYAWRFGSVFPGGVFWANLGGDEYGARRRYHRHLADTAHLLGLPAGGSPARLRKALAERLAENGPALWVVDDIPAGSDPEILHELVLPAGPSLRTILISDRDVFGDEVPLVRLDGLPAEDATAFLEAAQATHGREDAAALAHVVARVGGHGRALAELALLLRNGGGHISYARCAALLDKPGLLLTGKWAASPSSSHDLTGAERVVLGAATEDLRLDVAVAAAAVLREGLAGDHDEALVVTVNGLRDLAARFLATRTPAGWRAHPLARRFADLPAG